MTPTARATRRKRRWPSPSTRRRRQSTTSSRRPQHSRTSLWRRALAAVPWPTAGTGSPHTGPPSAAREQVPTKAFSKAFATANSGLEQLTELANKYDEEHKLKEKVVPSQLLASLAAAAQPRHCPHALSSTAKVLATIEGPREKAMGGAGRGVGARLLGLGCGHCSATGRARRHSCAL